MYYKKKAYINNISHTYKQMPITKCETYALHAGTQCASPIMRHICLARACLPQNATHMYRTMHAPCSTHAVRVTCLARLLSGCIIGQMRILDGWELYHFNIRGLLIVGAELSAIIILHYALCSIQVMNEIFDEKWIGRGGPAAWPPRSPDLTSPDYFLWGFVKYA